MQSRPKSLGQGLDLKVFGSEAKVMTKAKAWMSELKASKFGLEASSLSLALKHRVHDGLVLKTRERNALGPIHKVCHAPRGVRDL